MNQAVHTALPPAPTVLDALRASPVGPVLDAPLPAQLSVGRGSALFVCGWCFAREQRITSAALVLGGEAQPEVELVAATRREPVVHAWTVIDPGRAIARAVR